MTDHQCNQGARFTALEITDKYMAEKLDRMDKKIDRNHEEIKELIREIKDNFAAKRTETAVKWFISIVMGIVITAIVYQVITK